MNIEARLLALEADLSEIKTRLGMAPWPLRPASFSAKPATAPASDVMAVGPPPFIAAASTEVSFGSYWVSRIGAFLVLLAGLFLAAYLSIYSSPPIRLGELGAAALVAAGIAYWQQSKRNLQFAVVLHSLSDALVFFTAFAGYAFDATKVVDSIGTAIFIQTIAAVAVGAHALHRRSERSAAFALSLLCGVAIFSLNYQHSDTTLGFLGAVALLAAASRWLWKWKMPLALAAISCPALAVWLGVDFGGLLLPLRVAFGALPLILALPTAAGRDRLDETDRGIIFLSLIACFGALLILGYGFDLPAYLNGLEVQGGSALAVAALLTWRGTPEDRMRQASAFQAIFLGAVTAATFLFTRSHFEPGIPLGIFGIGTVTAWLLRRQKPFVSGYAYLVFCALGLFWLAQFDLQHGHKIWDVFFWAGAAGMALCAAMLQIALGKAPGSSGRIATGAVGLCSAGLLIAGIEPPSAALFTLLAIAVVFAGAGGRFPLFGVWAGAALVAAHLLVLASPAAGATEWVVALSLLAGADAAVLFLLKPLHRSRVEPMALIVVLGMLGTLFVGFARADLSWSATFAWVPLAAGAFGLGFVRGNPNCRVAALVGFGFCVIRLFLNDLNSAFTRIVAFFLLGTILLGVGYLYSRLHNRERPE